MLKIIIAVLVLIILAIIWLIYFSISGGKSYHQMFYPEYYTDPFPEDEFPPVNPSKYQRKVKEGYLLMKKKKLVILGLAYNLGEEGTHKFMKRLLRLVKDWKDYQIVIYAADSSDCTFEILKSYQIGIKRLTLFPDMTGICTQEEILNVIEYDEKTCQVLADKGPDSHYCDGLYLLLWLFLHGKGGAKNRFREW